ncbi:MAG: hypothetical protein KIT83_03565 [Bryobacterales bacterium]|nr:hypothetical protein [Bryobacterales bacterium]
MQNFTVVTGTVLIILGAVAYFASGTSSFTAFIPSVFGILLVACGQLAKNPARTKTFMHIAALLGLLGLLGSIQGIPQTISLLSGGEVARPAAAVSRAVMAVVLVVFVAAAVRSFIQARKARQAGAAT